MTTALVLSRLSPFDSQRVHAVYQRLGTQVEALGRVVERVVCLFLVPPDQQCTADELKEHEERLRRLWSPCLSLRLAPVVSLDEPLSAWQRIGRGIFDFRAQSIARPLDNPRAIAAVDAALQEQPALILAHRLSSMSVLMRLASTVRTRRVFFDMDDIEHIALRRRLLHDPSWPRERLLLLQTPRLMLAEFQAVRLAAATFVCSEADRRYLARFTGSERVHTVPNSVELPPLNEGDTSELLVIFVGSMSSRPNAHAVDTLVQKIWPSVRARVPGARLAIIGSSAQLTESYPSHDPSVSFLGFVEDLESWYRRARVVCCPIYHGAGTRVKIIEAAAHAKAVVSTHLGAEGLNFQDGREIVLRDAPEELARACVQMLHHADAAAQLGRAARERARNSYDRSAVVEQLARIVRTGLHR